MDAINMLALNKNFAKNDSTTKIEHSNTKTDFRKILNKTKQKFDKSNRKTSCDKTNEKENNKINFEEVSTKKEVSEQKSYKSDGDNENIENQYGLFVGKFKKEDMDQTFENLNNIQMDSILQMLYQLINIEKNGNIHEVLTDEQKIANVSGELKAYIEETMKSIIQNGEHISKAKINEAIDLIKNIFSSKAFEKEDANELKAYSNIFEKLLSTIENIEHINPELLVLDDKSADNKSFTLMTTNDKEILEAEEQGIVKYKGGHKNNEVILSEKVENLKIKNTPIINVDYKAADNKKAYNAKEEQIYEHLETIKNSFDVNNIAKFNNKNPVLEQVRILNKDEIFAKILEESSIINEGETSEIRIRLKPESLGKLTIRLIMENGEMSAKFIANNYKAKETIESSFAELKDALTEKGIDIQNLSVSVGNEGKWQYDNQFNDSWNNRGKQVTHNTNDIGDEELLGEDLLPYENPYDLNESYLDIRI